MKTQKMSKTLVLNKKSISNLSPDNMHSVQGGTLTSNTYPSYYPVCNTRICQDLPPTVCATICPLDPTLP